MVPGQRAARTLRAAVAVDALSDESITVSGGDRRLMGGRRGRIRVGVATRQQVARRPAEFDVDDEVEDEVHGEVDEQHEVGKRRCNVEGPIVDRATGSAYDEVEQIGGRDEQREQNDQRNESRRDAMR
jgi:hypothetical protein